MMGQVQTRDKGEIHSQILRTDGRFKKCTPAGGYFTLEEWREAIGGGWVEPVMLPDGGVLLVDEEGRLKGLPLNHAVRSTFGINIFGDALWMSQSFWSEHP